MIRLFKNFRKREILFICISVILIAMQVWLDLKLPDYMKEITILVQTEGSQMNDVLVAGGWMILCALGSLCLAFIVGYFGANIAASFSQKLREKVFSKTLSYSTEEIQKFSTASLITRSTNDITQIQMFIAMGLQVMIKAPILAAWAITKIAGKSWQWSILTASAVVFLLIIVTVMIIFVIPKFKKIQTLTDNINRITREHLTGIRVVKAYNAEKYQEEKFGDANKELADTHLFTTRMMAVIGPVMTMISSGLSLGIYWIGAGLINQADIMTKGELFGDMVTFMAYAMNVIMAFMMLIMIFIILPRASVSAKRINEVLDVDVKVKDGNIEDIEGEKGDVEFRNVSFKYPDAEEYILHNINFKANKGETVAFIGSTGSGKSTLINLIPRFYDVTEGSILLNGVDVKDYTLESLHNKIGYVSQKAILFSGTVHSNVAYGYNKNLQIGEEDIKESITIAQADFVLEMEEKLDSHVSQGGTNLSGGQKQRISIARAICRKPEILIFDDSFSALDYKTDKELRKTLREKINDTTKFIVAQRIATIKDADKIVVLDQGVIVGMGTHRELLGNCNTYREIAESQLSKEELAYE